MKRVGCIVELIALAILLLLPVWRSPSTKAIRVHHMNHLSAIGKACIL